MGWGRMFRCWAGRRGASGFVVVRRHLRVSLFVGLLLLFVRLYLIKRTKPSNKWLRSIYILDLPGFITLIVHTCIQSTQKLHETPKANQFSCWPVTRNAREEIELS